MLSAARDHSYLKHATALAEACDEAAFAAAFGGSIEQLPSLVKSNACTLPLLLRISPEGTPDPTPLLYNNPARQTCRCQALQLRRRLKENSGGGPLGKLMSTSMS